jgi:hypothetical protein
LHLARLLDEDLPAEKLDRHLRCYIGLTGNRAG